MSSAIGKKLTRDKYAGSPGCFARGHEGRADRDAGDLEESAEAWTGLHCEELQVQTGARFQLR